MFFFLFTTFSFSTWWEFNEYEFPKIVKNSFNLPLFALCFSPFCPHCHGLPEGFQNFNSGLGNRTDILITTIDCYNQGGCHFFALRGTPHIALVLGSNNRYWPVSPERGPEGWDRWINERIGPNLRQVFNISEIDDAKREPTDGGTTFLLEVPNSDDPYIEHLRDLSKTYRIYNDTFVFYVNKSISHPRLSAFYSEYCSVVYSGQLSGMKKFIEQNKFGVFHRYDGDEFKELIKSKKHAAILLTDNEPTKSQKESIRRLPKDRCSDNMIFGWALVKDDRKILSATKVKASDLPLIYHIDPNEQSNKNRIYKGKISKFYDYIFTSNHEGPVANTTNEQSKTIFYVKLLIFVIILIMNIVYVIKGDSLMSKEE